MLAASSRGFWPNGLPSTRAALEAKSPNSAVFVGVSWTASARSACEASTSSTARRAACWSNLWRWSRTSTR